MIQVLFGKSWSTVVAGNRDAGLGDGALATAAVPVPPPAGPVSALAPLNTCQSAVWAHVAPAAHHRATSSQKLDPSLHQLLGLFLASVLGTPT